MLIDIIRSFSSRTHASLSVISQKFDRSCESNLAIERRLDEIQYSVSAANIAIQTQSQLVNHVFQSVSANKTSHELFQSRQSQPLPWNASGGFLRPSLDLLATWDKVRLQQDGPLRKHSHDQRGSHHSVAAERVHQQYDVPNPKGSFELSPNFFPESYALVDFLPPYRLHTCDAFEEQSNEFFRTNSYSMFYMKGPRKWRRLSLSVMIIQQSIYWNCSKISSLATRKTFLPQTLHKRLEAFISEIDNLQDNTHLNVHLAGSKIHGPQASHEIQISATKPPLATASEKILNMLDDLGCPRYLENELVQMAMLSESKIFATYGDGRLLWEQRWSSSLPNASDLYTIQVLHCLKGGRGIADFTGIVVDSQRRDLKGYLIDVPGRRRMSEHISKHLASGKIVPWSQRERWGKQIVEAVCKVHSRGFVVGTLSHAGRPPRVSPVIIDRTGQALLWRFSNKLWRTEIAKGYLPPEFRQPVGTFREFSRAKSAIPKQETVDATPRSDIFHLGMVLWLLAENQPLAIRTYLCRKAGCQLPLGAPCHDEHADPVALPALGDDIPQYWKDIVSACRRHEPSQRPPAWEVLGMFPPHILSDSNKVGIAIDGPLDLSLVTQAPGVFCTLCAAETTAHVFHCDACSYGDFDMCPKCFDEEFHCYSQEHFLVERKSKEGWQMGTGSYYSSMKSHGRDVMVL